jgi:hypothetical protein
MEQGKDVGFDSKVLFHEDGENVQEVTKGGTAADEFDMRRMGKVQQLRVCFEWRLARKVRD